jgi:hypothetical protein
MWRHGQSAILAIGPTPRYHDHGNDRVMQMAETLVEIETCRVRPGMFVHLDLGWMDHPFPWNRFKVRSEDEVRILRDLGLKTVRYCLKRSETGPLDAAVPALGTDVAEAPPTVNAEMAAAIEEKRRRHEYLARYRAMMANSRKTLASAAQAVRDIHGDLYGRPAQSLLAAGTLVDGLTASCRKRPIPSSSRSTTSPPAPRSTTIR